MKICCCTIAMREEPLESQLPKIAEAGYDAAEVWFRHVDDRSDAELDAIRELANRLNLALEVVAPYMWLTQTPELLRETYTIVERAVATARRLGCPKIRTFTDSGPTGIGSDRATSQHWRTAIEALRRFCDTAPDLRFVVETHTHTLADTPATTERLIQETDRPNLRLNFQFSSIFDINAYVRLKPWIEHMHLHNQTTDGAPSWLEQGALDIGGFLDTIARDGYPHSLSVEYCFKGATWERLQSARAFVAAHVRASGRQPAA